VACRSYDGRRVRGEVTENRGVCSSCLVPLYGRQSDATVCISRKCLSWAARHPGVPHPSTKPRFCVVCEVSIDHRNGKAKYCGDDCKNADVHNRNRDDINRQKREAWADPGSKRKMSHRKYQKANADRYRQWARESRVKHPERHRAYYQKWLSVPAHYEQVILNGHKRRVLVRGASGDGGVSRRDWLRLVRRYRGCCAYCGESEASPVIEHVIPVSRGGRHTIGNVLPACGPCNSRKSTMFLSVWRYRDRVRRVS
jgi:hypothetical protein